MIFGPKMLLGSSVLVATNISIGTKLVVSGEFQPRFLGQIPANDVYQQSRLMI